MLHPLCPQDGQDAAEAVRRACMWGRGVHEALVLWAACGAPSARMSHAYARIRDACMHVGREGRERSVVMMELRARPLRLCARGCSAHRPRQDHADGPPAERVRARQRGGARHGLACAGARARHHHPRQGNSACLTCALRTARHGMGREGKGRGGKRAVPTHGPRAGACGGGEQRCVPGSTERPMEAVTGCVRCEGALGQPGSSCSWRA